MPVFTDTTKRCPACGETKPFSDFAQSKSVGQRGCSTYCKACNVKRMVKWQRDNRERYRERVRNWRFGVTTKQWNEIFEKQGRCCALCRSDHSNSKYDWQSDHNHETGQFRGILCLPCNIALGMFEERLLPIMERVEDYRIRQTGFGHYTERLIRTKANGQVRASRNALW